MWTAGRKKKKRRKKETTKIHYKKKESSGIAGGEEGKTVVYRGRGKKGMVVLVQGKPQTQGSDKKGEIPRRGELKAKSGKRSQKIKKRYRKGSKGNWVKAYRAGEVSTENWRQQEKKKTEPWRQGESEGGSKRAKGALP